MSFFSKMRTKKDSTTKAGWLWQALHTEFQFSGAFTKAVLDNDGDADRTTSAIADALEIVGLMPEEAELSEAEFLAFGQGLTPSGELEVTAWEGYYTTDPLPNGDVFALLISSARNRVYWGREYGFMDGYWSECEVDYYLGPNATLSFSSSDGEDVTLSFSRIFDEETGDASMTKVTGTVGGTSISGAPRSFPLPKKTFSIPRRLPWGRVSPSFTNDDHKQDNPVNTFDWKSALAAYGALQLGGNFIGYLCPGVRIRWYKFWWKLRFKLNDQMEELQDIKHTQFSSTWVDLNSAESLSDVKREVRQELNRKLDNVDLAKNVEDIILENDLRKSAHTHLDKTVRDRLKLGLKSSAESMISDMPADVVTRLKEQTPGWVNDEVDNRAETVMDNFAENSPGIQDIVNYVTMERRNEHYRQHVQDHTREIDAIDKLVADREEKKQEHEADAAWWREKAKTLTDPVEKANALSEASRLDREIEKVEQDINRRKEERDVVEDKRKEAEAESKRYSPKEWEDRWDKEAKDHIKPPRK